MSSPRAPGDTPDSDAFLPNGELPEQVAELAGELAEAEDESRRKRIARRIPVLAARSGQATRRGLASGGYKVRQGLQSGTGAAARRVGPATARAQRGVRAGTGAAARRVGPATTKAQQGVRTGGSVAWRGLRSGGQWLTSEVLEMAPKVPIRNLATLQAQHPGLDAEQLADALIVGASRASAGVGAAVGAAAAVPFVPTAPVELGVETMALVAIELKLIAELHEVYGMQPPGSAGQRMIAYLVSWTDRRGVRVTTSGLALAVGSPLRRRLERRLLAKAGQSALALAPLLTGAAAGALLDYRETRRLGQLVREDLGKRAIAG